jgi:hypothetical protein
LGGGAFTAAQSVAVEVTAAEAVADSKAATAAHEAAAEAACRPLLELYLVQDYSGGAETIYEVDFTAFLAFGVGARACVLPATVPGVLPHLAVGCGEAIVVAFDPHTCEYTAKALSVYSRLQTKTPYYAAVAVSRDGNQELKLEAGRSAIHAPLK